MGSKSQVAYIYIYIYITCLSRFGPWWAPRNSKWHHRSYLHMSSRCTNSQRSGRVCYNILSRKAYYSSQVSRICVAAVTRTLEAMAIIISIELNRAVTSQQYSLSLRSPVAVMTNPWKYVADRGSIQAKVFVASPAKLLLGTTTILAIGWLTKY